MDQVTKRPLKNKNESTENGASKRTIVVYSEAHYRRFGKKLLCECYFICSNNAHLWHIDKIKHRS